MRRDALAYLSDIVESCDAISAALLGLGLGEYERTRLVRSSVEREFIIFGEAISTLSHAAPDAFAAITRARRIVDFRNQLTHEYATGDDTLVWAIADRDVRVLRDECSALMKSIEARGEVIGIGAAVNPPTPATPPCVRVRTRRFDRLRSVRFTRTAAAKTSVLEDV
jgi:uncharacterized protein with HEPN domain